VSKTSDPDRLNNIRVANVSDQDFISPATGPRFGGSETLP